MRRLAFLVILILGMAAGASRAYGVGWVLQQHSDLPGSVPLVAVSFGDARHGCVMGDVTAGSSYYVAVLTTSDGGATWVRQADVHLFDTHDVMMSDLKMLDGMHGWAAGAIGGGGVIYSTSDGGAHWELRLLTLKPILALDFPDKDHAWAVGTDAAVYSTADGGATWTDHSYTQPPWTMLALDFVDPLHGCLAGVTTDASGAPLARLTADGCQTWLPGDFSLIWVPVGVALRDATHAVVVGMNGIATIDGQVRRYVYGESMCDFRAVAFADARHVHAVGGKLVASDDGGQRWQVQQSPLPDTTYRDVCFLDERHGWAVGTAGAIIAYDSAPPITTASGADGLWHNQAQTVHLNALDDPDSSGVADIASIVYQLNGSAAATTAGTDARVIVPIDVAHSTDGVNTISYGATDKAGNIEAVKTVSVRIDSRRPHTAAPARADAHRGAGAFLKYIVIDRAPNAGKAKVTIKIRNADRRIMRTLKLGLQRVNLLRKARFTCTLPAGRYRFSVYATDMAGNKQTRVGVNTLIVR
jgi:photosystem II stability/assembly factor-like uncharacterized protein